ncbi:cytochrome c biogenesis protein ResB [Propionibacteriaceae bacterium Y2011]
MGTRDTTDPAARTTRRATKDRPAKSEPDATKPDATKPDATKADATTADDTKAKTPRRGTEEAPALGLRATLRYWWNQLTSMRTALILLFCLALAAIPGSIVPQRSVSPIQVEDFIEANPGLGEFYDRIGMFDVFSSVWFSSIYLLLFVSLIGCILPRVMVYAKAVRAEPVRTPARLTRLPVHQVVARRTETGDGTDAENGAEVDDTDDVLERAAEHLRSRRFRVAVRGDNLSAERGYLREAGNLVFHLSLVLLLIGVAIGTLYGYRGSAIVVVGNSFSNTMTQYDDLTSGPRFDAGDLAPFHITVDHFEAQFETGEVQTGAARVFRADTTVIDRPGATPRQETIEVNHPLEMGGTQVHVLGHGYAPTVTVRDSNGDIAWQGPVVFLPQDGNFSSAGAIKAVDARPEQLAFQGFFLPTGIVDEYGPRSVFPDALAPRLFLNAWYGPPRVETGEPQNVYSLDTRGLTQFTEGDDVLRMQMKPGDTVTLPDGKGSITFDGYDRWVKLQISRTPALWLTAGSIGAAVLGLCLSLFIRPRRLWVRVTDDEIHVAGLDRADARHGLDDDVAALAAAAGGGSEEFDAEDDEDGEDHDREDEDGEDEDGEDEDGEDGEDEDGEDEGRLDKLDER